MAISDNFFLIITHISGEMPPDYVMRSMHVMTTNVPKEKFEYLAFAFISDHLQKILNK